MKNTPEITHAVSLLPEQVAIGLNSISHKAFEDAISPTVAKKASGLLCKEAGYLWLTALINLEQPLDNYNFNLLLINRVQYFLKIAESNLYLDIATEGPKGALTEGASLDYLALQYILIAIYARTAQQPALNDAVHRISTLVTPFFIESFGKDGAAQLFTNAMARQVDWKNTTVEQIYTNLAEFLSLDKLLAEIETDTKESQRLSEVCHKPYTTRSILEAYETLLKNLDAKIAKFERIAIAQVLKDRLLQITPFRKILSNHNIELPNVRLEIESWLEHDEQKLHRSTLFRTRSLPEPGSATLDPVNPPGGENLRNRKPRGKSLHF